MTSGVSPHLHRQCPVIRTLIEFRPARQDRPTHGESASQPLLPLLCQLQVQPHRETTMMIHSWPRQFQNSQPHPPVHFSSPWKGIYIPEGENNRFVAAFSILQVVFGRRATKLVV